MYTDKELDIFSDIKKIANSNDVSVLYIFSKLVKGKIDTNIFIDGDDKQLIKSFIDGLEMNKNLAVMFTTIFVTYLQKHRDQAETIIDFLNKTI